MRILALQETDWVARNPIMHHRMLEGLSRRGDDVTVIDYDLNWQSLERSRLLMPRRVGRAPAKYYADAQIKLIRPRIVRLPGLSRISWLAANWREIRAALLLRTPEVVVGYGISNALLGAHMAQHAGVPFVYHLLDALHTLVEPTALRPVARRVEQLALRRADRVIVINRHLGTYARNMGARPSRIAVLPQGYAPRTFGPVEQQRVRETLGVRDEELLLLFVGWLYDFSGLLELATVLARRKHQFSGVRLAIVGSGDLDAELVGIRNSGLGDQLLLLGQRPVTEIQNYIGASDVCLLPALRTPAMEHIVPSKVGEYMEMGKPIIATRLPGLEAEFGDLPGILWIDRPEEVLDQVSKLYLRRMGPRTAAAALGQTCQSFVMGRGDWGQATDRFRDLLRFNNDEPRLMRHRIDPLRK